ncbi:hypothetical protein [Xylanimonas protaetiae]|uniref:hypothetical protein n=1 Tax=Xylanimonas protaetiae TaxID=2509457 RepID=UPI0013EB2DD8|nr:hypothetical protein [Xylanimonas protaetiae]
MTGLTIAGGSLFVVVTHDGAPAQVLTGRFGDDALVPDARIAVGATTPLVSGTDDALWVLGDAVQVLPAG